MKVCLVGKAKFLDDDAYVKEGLAILKFHDGMPATYYCRPHSAYVVEAFRSNTSDAHL